MITYLNFSKSYTQNPIGSIIVSVRCWPPVSGIHYSRTTAFEWITDCHSLRTLMAANGHWADHITTYNVDFNIEIDGLIL